ncbi:MAG TPA: PAS domain-containing protein [Oscillatoriales cyanobacterium M59_W2019_021]|nr:MAG: PAS domain S-box protein [Cyanobacteria bacterium J055]HIK32391.1 PAS domain-containing protein [Oscillatoriales cyanobacterium M4454_W2019_049]HIK52754.1 PAS domain-containing protein [Oscillatoriales cyanobacterium M59_W2019_021]
MHDEMNARTDPQRLSIPIDRSEIGSTPSCLADSPPADGRDFLYTAFDRLDNPMGVKDQYHRWVWANEAFCRWTGRSREALVGRTDGEVFGADVAALFWERDEAVLRTGTSGVCEEAIPAGNGVGWWRTQRSRGYDASGNPVAISIFQPIEPPSSAVPNFGEDGWKLAIDRLPQAIFWKDRHSVYRGCNQKFAQLLKLQRPEDIIGKTDRDLPWKLEDVEKIRRWDARILACQISERHRIEIQPLSDECRIVLNLHQISLPDESGVPIGILGMVEDVTDRQQLDLALRDYHNELLTLFGAMQDVILVLDCEGCYLRIVPTGTSLLYKPESELIGKTFHDIFPSETADRFLAAIQKTLSSQKTTHLEYSLLLEKTEVWFEASIAPLRANEVVWVARDITQRKLAELSKEETQQRLQAILDYTPTIIFIKDKNGKYLTINRQISSVLNLEPAEILGKTDLELFSAKIADRFQEHDRQILDLEIPITYEHNVEIGDRVRTYLTIEFPLKNAAGEIYALGGIATDITERKQAEEKLQQKTFELEKTLLKLQKMQLQLVQTEKMSSLGQLVAGIAHEINNPINFIHANLNHARMYIEDIFKLLEIYQEKLSPEIPEISEKLEEMDWDFVRDDLPKLLGSMQVGTQRIRNIVRSLRTFSRLDETGIKRADLHEGLESTLMMLQHRLTPKPGCPEIQVLRDYGEIPPIECDAGQLNQVFLNILTNALDALDLGFEIDPLDARSIAPGCNQPTISIRTERSDGDRISIRIANNGPHIPAEIQRRLFDPFFTTKPVGKGTGIGLSISYQIVAERHRGSLRCISRPGEGAEFIIKLPIRQVRS